MAEDRTNRIPVPAQVPLRNKSNQALAIRWAGAISPIVMKIVENMVVLQKRRHDDRYGIYGLQGGITGQVMRFCRKEQ